MTFSGSCVRGDDLTIYLTVTQPTQADPDVREPVDFNGITGATLKVKETISGTMTFTRTLGNGVDVYGDPVEGVLKITVPSETTETLNAVRHFFEVEILDSGGNKSTVRAEDLSLGELTVLEDL